MTCNPIPAFGCPQPTIFIAPPSPSSDDSASGSVTGGTPAAATAQNFRYPVTSMGLTVPAVNGLAQVSVAGASGWASPGLLVWVPSHNGYFSVTGNSGDLVTLRNLTLQAGNIISAGTPIIPAAPPQVTAEGAISQVTALSSLSGNFGGLPVTVEPTLGALMIGNGSTWNRLAASPLIRLATQPTLLTVKRDVIASTAGSSAATRWAGPVWGGSGGAPAPLTTTFPNFPTVPAGLPLTALVQCDWKFACLVAGALCIEVTINGVVSRITGYCSAVAQALSTLEANIRTEGPGGQFQIMIPVPSDNAAVNVSTYVRKNELSSGDANCHYILNYKVLGYFVG